MDSKIPEGYLFTKQHEWAKEEGGFLTVGISDYAQNALGDSVYVDLKAPGTKVEAGETFGTIESVKAALHPRWPLRLAVRTRPFHG